MQVTSEHLPPGAQLLRFHDAAAATAAHVVLIEDADALVVLSWFGTPPTRTMIDLLKGLYPSARKINWGQRKAPQWI